MSCRRGIIIAINRSISDTVMSGTGEGQLFNVSEYS